MITLQPLRALRPMPQYASQVACVPYDVVNTKESRALAEGNPYSFLRVVRSELELPDATDPYSQQVYQQAQTNLKAFIDQGIFFNDPVESLYIYRLEMEGRAQVGILGCSAVADYQQGRIKTHEKTRPEKVNDRVQHIINLNAQAEPVFLAYREKPEISELVNLVTSTEPLYDFVAIDGIRHTIWKANNSSQIVSEFNKVPCVYIADGHHRSESAKEVQKILQNSTAQNKESSNYFLSVTFPDTQLKIMPYNRIIKQLTKSPEQILSELSQHYIVEPGASPSPQESGQVCMFLQNKWFVLCLRDPRLAGNDPVESLDVSVLQRLVLGPIFGIEDPRTDKNIDFVGGIRGTKELEKLVLSGQASCAFSMFPVTMNQLLSVADAGRNMPPKSTWFEPKLRSGLIVHTF